MDLHLFEKGGPLMCLLLLCSIAAVGVILERCVFWLVEKRQFRKAHLTHYLDLVCKNRIAEAAEFGGQGVNQLLQRLSVLLSSGQHSLVRDAVEIELNAAEDRARRHMSGLSFVVAVAPLLGILGTVLGIISSFAVLEEAMLSDPNAIGAGLAEALLTTAAGLGLAVPCLLASSLLNSVTERHLRSLESFGDELSITLAIANQVDREEKDYRVKAIQGEHG